jgi:GTP-binding protein
MVMLKFLKKPKSIFQNLLLIILKQESITICAFVLIDIRHEAQTIDIEFMSYMKVKFFCIVFTKADKISKVKLILILLLKANVCQHQCRNARITL